MGKRAKCIENCAYKRVYVKKMYWQAESQLASADEAAIELYEASLAQWEITAAQDDALIELYEMLGGEI